MLVRVVVAPLLAFAFAAVALAQGVERGGALPGPLPLFPPGNWWNADVSAAPVDPSSAARDVVIERLRGIPLGVGAPLGHGALNEAVPFGAKSTLDLDRGTFEISDAAVQ